jgi:hypothetical protein
MTEETIQDMRHCYVIRNIRASGSGGRTRTYDQAVNSRPLYH